MCVRVCVRAWNTNKMTHSINTQCELYVHCNNHSISEHIWTLNDWCLCVSVILIFICHDLIILSDLCSHSWITHTNGESERKTQTLNTIISLEIMMMLSFYFEYLEKKLLSTPSILQLYAHILINKCKSNTRVTDDAQHSGICTGINVHIHYNDTIITTTINLVNPKNCIFAENEWRTDVKK